MRFLSRFLRTNMGRFGLVTRMRVLERNETDARHVVAFSLYGDNPRYVRGGMMNVDAYSRWFPEFVCRFYVAQDMDSTVIGSLRDAGAEVFVMWGRGVDPRYAFWRFLASEDCSKDRFLVRDIDSVGTQRERDMYLQWVASGRSYNVIRDHYSHDARIMAGMWGGLTKPGFMSALLPRAWRYRNHYSRDQNFLAGEVYPRIRHDLFVQDIVNRFPDEEVSLQPVDERDFAFIGEIATDVDERSVWRSHFRSMHVARAR